MSFETSRLIPASVDAVFRAIQDPVRLARWWGPQGFANTFEAFDFAPGGRWKYVMHGPDGTAYRNESVFEDIVPNRRVVVRHLSKPTYELVITLAAAGEATNVSWRQAFDDPRFTAAMREVIEPANEQNLDRLTEEATRAGA